MGPTAEEVLPASEDSGLLVGLCRLLQFGHPV